MPGAARRAAAEKIAKAIKASGTIVKVEPEEFLRILAGQSGLLVVTAVGGFITDKYHYLTSYKGLAFFSESKTELTLPTDTEVVAAQEIWIPR